MSSEASLSPEYTGYRLEIFVGVFTPLCAVAVALRFYARSLSASKYDAGDWLIGAALVGQIGAAALGIGAVKHAGVGYHAAYLEATDPEKVTTFLKYLVAMSTWYATTESLAKLAVCLLYKHIFPQRWIRITVNITIAVLIGASVGGGLADLFGCTPFSAHWGTAAEQAAHCADMEALFTWGSFPNIVTDAVLLVLPIPSILKLHASAGMRAGLMITFLFGSIGIITSILRFVAFANKSSFTDPTYNSTSLIIWTICEPGVYLIAACLLVYRPLLDKIGIPMILSSKIRGKSGGTSGDFKRGRITMPPSAHTPMNRNIELYPSGGSSFDRTVVSGGFQDLEYGDERPLKSNAGITARTDIDVEWRSRAM